MGMGAAAENADFVGVKRCPVAQVVFSFPEAALIKLKSRDVGSGN
jgi:hypothetical protein